MGVAYVYIHQARRKQLQIGGGGHNSRLGGAHIKKIKMRNKTVL